MPRKPRRPGKRPATAGRGDAPQPSELRIIGGVHARRKLLYAGDPRTRPMKDRVREAVFNLIGPAVVGKHAIDLFAGTGALGLEAISRGAARATFIEQHFPTADLIRKNITALGVDAACRVIAADTFRWIRPSPCPLPTRERDFGKSPSTRERGFSETLPTRDQPLATRDQPLAARDESLPARDQPLPARGRDEHSLLADEPWLVFCSPPYDFYVDRVDEIVTLLTTLISAAAAGSAFVVETDRRFDFARLPSELPWDVREYPPARIGIGRK